MTTAIPSRPRGPPRGIGPIPQHMATIKAKRGLDLPIHGAPTSDTVVDRLDVRRVALMPQQSWGIKVRLLAQEGDAVKVGTPLFVDRRDDGVLYCSPAAGKIAAVHRGHRRAVLSVVIDVDGFDDAEPCATVDVAAASRDEIRAALMTSGLWPALRRRPYDKVAASTDDPAGIVVQAYDSSPLAPDLRKTIAGREDDLAIGLEALKKLTDGNIHLCAKDGENFGKVMGGGVLVHHFDGPHPSGTAGFSMHKVCPAGANRTVWHIGIQDVCDIGQLFRSGQRPTTRVVAVTGPAAKEPKLIRTRPGADMAALLEGESTAARTRLVNGSCLWGDKIDPEQHVEFLGRWNTQVTILEDDVKRDLVGWALPVSGRYTQTNTVWDKFFRKTFKYDTDTNGSLRAIVPMGHYEAVMPMDVLATQLIKSLASGDLEGAEKLGVLELAEEDLALCQVVDPSKIAITDMLREMLTTIEKEG